MILPDAPTAALVTGIQRAVEPSEVLDSSIESAGVTGHAMLIWLLLDEAVAAISTGEVSTMVPLLVVAAAAACVTIVQVQVPAATNVCESNWFEL